jgi:hypothetical protein
MASRAGRGLGWLEPALAILSRRYFGRGPTDGAWSAERWMRATAAALTERLGPALGEACGELGVQVPKRGWALLTSARLENERRTSAQHRALAEIGPAFEAAGLRPVLFKGPALARYYPAPAVRETGDIDLLIAPDELRQAEEVLRAAGFRYWAGGGRLSTRYAVAYVREDDQQPVTFDLHPAWHEVALSEGGIEALVAASRESLASAEIAGGRWPVLAPALELYLTAAHAVLHGFRTLSVYLDLALQLAAGGDDELARAAELARSVGRERHLRHAVTAAAQLFDLEAERAYISTPGRLGVPIALRLGYLGSGFRLVPSSLVMELALRRGVRRKLAFARWVLGHEGKGGRTAASGRRGGRLRRALRGLRWLKGTTLRYRIPHSSPLRL